MLEYNVFLEDFNRRRIVKWNIFNHCGFADDCKKVAKECKSDKAFSQFEEDIREKLMYYFWSKCEYEIILSAWPPFEDGSFKDEKVSVYDQVMINWDAFIKYFWDHRGEIT